MRALQDTVWLILAVVLLTSVRISIPAPASEPATPRLEPARAAAFVPAAPAGFAAAPSEDAGQVRSECRILALPDRGEALFYRFESSGDGKILESELIPLVFEPIRPAGPIRFRTVG